MVMVLATSKRINVAPDVREDPKLEWPELWNQLTLDIVSNYRAGRSREGSLLSWSFKLSQPLRITSGLRETFIKRYIVKRTNKAEIRPEEQNEKAESFRENLIFNINTEFNTVERATQTEIDTRTLAGKATDQVIMVALPRGCLLSA